MKQIDTAYRHGLQKEGHGHICYVLGRRRSFAAMASTQPDSKYDEKKYFKSNLPFKG